jgi:hypothetical protein
MNRGQIPVTKIGKRVMVNLTALRRDLENV